MDYNFDNERPIYIQLVKMIRIKIVSGNYKKGEKLPSVRDLAFMMKVNPNTMQKALVALEDERLIYTERTTGKYVTNDEVLIEETKKNLAKDIINNYLDSMNCIGINKRAAIKYLQELGG